MSSVAESFYAAARAHDGARACTWLSAGAREALEQDQGLSIAFLAIFLPAHPPGQAIAGHGSFNHDQLLHNGSTISLGRYLTTSEFAADVAENWQSEYPQFTLYIFGTVWLLQRASAACGPRSTPTRCSSS